jgi:D-3-phosphoglycerate dehydrogenase
VHDPFIRAEDFENCSLKELCTQSDVLTLHVPYSDKTHHIISSELIQAMKPGSFVVNVSRGGLVDEVSLLRALESGHLAGAALDCFEQEPYFGPLSKLENVQMTAHMGTYARETRDLMEREASQLMVKALQEMNLLK